MSEKLLSNFMHYFFLPNVPFAYFSFWLLKQTVSLPSVRYSLFFNNRTLILFQNIICPVQTLHFTASSAFRGDYATEFRPGRWKQNYRVDQLRSLFKESQLSFELGLFTLPPLFLWEVWGTDSIAEACSGRTGTEGALISDDFLRPLTSTLLFRKVNLCVLKPLLISTHTICLFSACVFQKTTGLFLCTHYKYKWLLYFIPSESQALQDNRVIFSTTDN